MSSQTASHVAIIMDGNGRWARSNGFANRWEGHRYGVQAVRTVIRAAIEHGLDTLTLYAFSQENNHRAPEEVKYLIKLLEITLLKEADQLVKNGVRLKCCGDIHSLSPQLEEATQIVEEKTQHCNTLRLNMAINYSGRWHIHEAMKTLSQANLSMDTIDQSIQEYMQAPFGSDPDLLIRTSGEHRLSNFMLYHLAYTDLYFTDVLWPDFSKVDFEKALQSFNKRERRYGKVKACRAA